MRWRQSSVLVALGISSCSVGPGDSPFASGVTIASDASAADNGSSADEGVAATTSLPDDETDTANATSAASGVEATSNVASSTSGSSSGVDTTETNSATNSGGESSDDTTSGGTPLDRDLDVPERGEICAHPGDLNDCPGVAVCRFATVEFGRCESCEACGNLNAPCTEGSDCDILFACYAGRCTNFCTLGNFGCGAIDDCLDVGHATVGVCDPFA